jgi:hypothetical protein
MSQLLAALSITTLWGANLLAAANLIERPRQMMCNCNFYYRSAHLPSWGLFATGAGYIAHAIITIGTADYMAERVFQIFFLALGGLYLRLWWKHSKNKRKRLLERVLGVVRVTVAGLKVVPVPAGGHA